MAFSITAAGVGRLSLFRAVPSIAVSAALSVALSAADPHFPDSCACPDPFAPETPEGVIWQGLGPAPDLPALAHLLAPVLWFSSDEPLLMRRGQAAIPEPHPCDAPSEQPVVYYQVSDIVLRTQERVEGSGETDARFFEKVDHFALVYFFYYREDFGFGRHHHDLEAIRVLAYLDVIGDDCFRVRVRRVEGLAHGSEWYTNILRTERDTVYPLTILVEEGKHASVPDRNADGVYTPGYDVNRRVNDAWGLRDVFGSAVLLGASYSASMSKPRAEEFRLLPPNDAPVCGGPWRRRASAAAPLGRYELRAAAGVPLCRPRVPEPGRLLGMMRDNRFGAAYPANQYESDLQRELSDPENALRWISGINARVESNRVGVTVQGPGLDLPEFWLVPRAHFDRGWAVEALLTPSASRWIDWYAAVGYERHRARPRAAIGPDERSAERHLASELGVKFRVTVPGRLRWVLLGYRFGGLRLGVRVNGFSHLHSARVALEIGAGVF